MKDLDIAGIKGMVRLYIIKHALLAGAIGVPGAFFLHSDTPIIIGIWVKIFNRIAKETKRNFSSEEQHKIVVGVLAGVALFLTGVKAANGVVALTIVGTVPAILANAGLNGVLTYSYGLSLYKILTNSSIETPIDEVINGIVKLISVWGTTSSPTHSS